MSEDDYEELEDIERKLKESIISKYKQKLEEQLSPEDTLSKSYSHDYQQFKKEQSGRFHLLFEFLCIKANKLLKVNVKQKDKDKIEPFLRLAHFNVTPESVYSLAYLLSIISLFLSVFVVILLGNFFLIMLGIVGMLFSLFFITSYPKTTFIKWRARASDQLVLSVMYMVIQMERVSNLELAVEFVARHTAPPISLDFMKILWDIESKQCSSISESLEAYIETWRGWNDDFIEAVHLVEFSLQQKAEKERKETLARSTKVVLDGTQEHMLHYAHSLQGPMQALHMLGVVLPIMALVMLPLMGAFMGASIRWYHLAILYNLLFPIVVYYLGKDMLQKRPAGTSGLDSYTYMRQKYTRPYLKILGMNLKVPPIILAAITFLIVGSPALIYFTGLIIVYYQGLLLEELLFTTKALIFALDLILAIGISVGVYYFYSVHYLVKIKRKIERIEAEFPSGVFQLANRIKEKVPAEVAFEKVARTMPGSDIGTFFWLIDYNLKKQGSSLYDAIFNEQYGAIPYYPSGIINSAMSVMVDAVKKGPKSAAKSLFSIAKYLTNLRRVNSRLKDLLSETTSSMRMQIALFIPLITGLIIGLNMLITRILRNLGEVLSDIPTSGGAQMNLGSEMLSIFQFEYMIPAFVSALIVGIYIVQIIVIISYLVTGIDYGYDTIELKYLIGKNLFMAMPFFCIVASLAGLMLTNLVNVMPMVGA